MSYKFCAKGNVAEDKCCRKYLMNSDFIEEFRNCYYFSIVTNTKNLITIFYQ